MTHRMWTSVCLLAVFATLPILTRPSTVQAQTEPAKNDAVAELMKTVGMLSGLQLYQTYLNIGFIADGKAEGVYKVEDVTQLLASVTAPLTTVDKQLEKIAKLARTREDQEGFNKLRNIAGLLRTQGKALETFWTTGKESDGEKYETARKQAWKAINALLQLEKE